MDDKLELYGALTGNCIRAAIALEEANLPYAVTHVDLRMGQQRQALVLALNPRGQVPVLVKHSVAAPLVLTQSNAIIMFAASAAPDALLQGGSAKNIALVQERFFYFITDVIAVSHAAFALRGASYDESAHFLDARFIAALKVAENFLRDSQFIAGDAFSIADIAAFTIVRSTKNQLPWTRLPRMAKWYDMLETRPAVSRGLRVFDI